MKKIIIILSVFMGFSLSAQVGINTSSPSATLDVVAKNPNGSSTTVDGIVIPRVDRERAKNMASVELSTLIYVNDETTGTATGIASKINQKGFYYFDGTKWDRFSLSTTNVLDIGYIVGWSATSTPADYLIPISGGTFNWVDYPDLQTLHAANPIQFIQSSTATTFTLKNINGAGRFLRGGTTVGTEQAQATTLPNVAFTTSSAGAHTHTVDPVAISSMGGGAHGHTSNATGGGSGSYGLARTSVSGQSSTTTGLDNGASGSELDILNPTTALTINNATDHTHVVDIPSTTSSLEVAHTHTIAGGDAETRPVNISVMWCLKAKTTSTSGPITINNSNSTVLTTNGTSGAATLVGSTLNIPQYAASNMGDIKTGIQTTDHGGWIKLNGRAKTTLTATQQAQASALGIGTNLPDASNAFLVQNGTALGSVSGSNTTNINQNQLPNISIGIPSHSHTSWDYYISNVEAINGFDTADAIGIPYNNNWSSRMKMNESGGEGLRFFGQERSFNTSSVSMNTNSINGNVSQVQLDKTPKSLSVTTFIYLGF